MTENVSMDNYTKYSRKEQTSSLARKLSTWELLLFYLSSTWPRTPSPDSSGFSHTLLPFLSFCTVSCVVGPTNGSGNSVSFTTMTSKIVYLLKDEHPRFSTHKKYTSRKSLRSSTSASIRLYFVMHSRNADHEAPARIASVLRFVA